MEDKIKILYVLPSLTNSGPMLVVRDIVENLDDNYDVTIAFFDDVNEVSFPESVKLQRISFGLAPKFLSQFDIVHTHLYRSDIFGAINRVFIKKLITTVHSDMYEFMKRTYGKRVGLVTSCIWSLCVSVFNKRIFLTKYQKSKFCVLSKLNTNSIIPNGRKPNDEKENVEKYRDFDGKIVLGACAHVVKLKGFEQILYFLKEDTSDIYRFYLVGDGPHLKYLKSMALKLGIKDKVHFEGRRFNVYPYLNCFDLYVLTSESEGMPLALLEAASSKLPIITSDLPVIKEIFSETEVAFYTLNDIASLKAAIEKANSNRESLSRNVYNLYLENYTDKVMSMNYQKLYQQILKL
jgi:glycosyltransferase involved in cell wall biosynthesis